MKVYVAILSLLLFISACSPKTDSDAYSEAKEKLTNGDYYGGLVDFQKLLKEYPETEFRANALVEIAKLYHGSVDTANTKEEGFRNAVKYYKIVYSEYPDSSFSYKSMFMAGFLCANELKDFEEAKSIYGDFIKRYPDSDLAKSAQIEIDNLGISADEILKKKVSEK